MAVMSMFYYLRKKTLFNDWIPASAGMTKERNLFLFSGSQVLRRSKREYARRATKFRDDETVENRERKTGHRPA